MKTIKIILINIILCVITLLGCKKESKESENPPNSNLPENEVQVITNNLELNPETKIISSEEWTNHIVMLDSLNGTFRINQNLVQKNNLKVGSIIVSGHGDGFLRKVKSISETGDNIRIETDFCALDEVFKEGEFTIKVNGGVQKSAQSDINITKENKLPLEYDSRFVDIKGEYTLGNAMELTMSIQNYSLQSLYFSYGIVNEFEATAGVKLQGKGEKYLYIQRLPKITAMVGTVPVVIVPVVALSIGGEITGKPVPLDFKFMSGFGAKVVISYDGQWHYDSYPEYYSDFDIPKFEINDETNVLLKAFLKPEILFKIYGTVSPYFNLAPYGQVEARYKANPAWTAYIGAEMGGGIKAKIFSKKIFDIEASFFDAKIPVAYGENTLSIVSGNHQKGYRGMMLPNPLVAKVTNIFGYPLSGYKVNFNMATGGGTLSKSEVITNNEGEVAINVRMGLDDQRYEIEAKSIEINSSPHKDKPLFNSPVIFYATNWDGILEASIWKIELQSVKTSELEIYYCTLQAGGIAKIGNRTGTWTRTGNTLVVSWVATSERPPGCTYTLTGTINGATYQGKYLHYDYDEKGTQSLFDNGNFSGYMTTEEDSTEDDSTI